MPFDKLTILIIDNSPDWTGAIKSILNSIKNIDANFILAIPKHSRLIPVLQKENIQFIEISFLEVRKHWSVIFYLPVLIYNSISIARYCRKNKIQIIHVNDFYNLTGIGAKMLNPSVKLIQHVRLLPGSYVSLLYKLLIRLVSKFADAIVTVSEISKTSIAQHTRRNVTVIYDSVSIPESQPQRERDDDHVRFLYPANYVPGKGQEFALQAFAHAVKQNQNIFLTFVGSDLGQQKNSIFKKDLSEQIQSLKLENFVRLGDFEPNIFEALDQHDVVLNFSASESFSMVCLETLLAGKVLIATDSGGPKELFENGKSGFLIDRNVEAMKDAILRVAGDASLRTTIGTQGKRFASLKFDPLASARQLEQIYLTQVTNTLG